jgi:thiamine pyrophosphokinase
MVESARLREVWDRADLRIAADGGARNVRLFLGRAPQVVIGDMDSIDPETDAWLAEHRVELLEHPRAKDETDLELALALAAERGATESVVLGAFGGRPDHYFANVMLLARTPHLKMMDETCEMWVGIGDDTLHGSAGDIVSLIPLDSAVTGVKTYELEYPLREETLERGSTRGISNVMLNETARVSWWTGTLLLVHVFH